jgi:hypothetical protein
MTVSVEAYSGHKANERPQRFRLGERWYDVREILDRWYSPDARYFKVAADDGNLYILRLDERTQEWSLGAFQAAGYRANARERTSLGSRAG